MQSRDRGRKRGVQGHKTSDTSFLVNHEKLQFWRSALGLTLEVFAEKCKMSERRMLDVLQGGQRVRRRNAEDIIKYLNEVKDVIKIDVTWDDLVIATPDEQAYRDAVISATSFMDIRGIGQGGTRARLLPLSKLYINLQVKHTAGQTSLLEFAMQNKRSAILGQAGAGKTTSLKRLAEQCARNVDAPLPIWQDATRLYAHIQHVCSQSPEALDSRPDPTVSGMPALLIDFLVKGKLQGKTLQEYGFTPQWLDWKLARGEAVLLIDAWDELLSEVERGEMARIIDRCVERWKDARWLITSRPGVWTGQSIPLDFNTVEILDLGLPEIEGFIGTWTQTLYDVGRDYGQVDEARNMEEALVRAIRERPFLRNLAGNPLMLTAMAVVHFYNRQRLPEGRVALYTAIIDWLIAYRRKFPGLLEPDPDLEIRRHYQELALKMMKVERQTTIDLSEGAKSIQHRFAPTAHRSAYEMALEFLQREETSTGILVSREDGRRVAFLHLSFQEYLAACHLAEMEPDQWWTEVAEHLWEPEWRETLRSLAVRLYLGGRARIQSLVSAIVKSRKSDVLEHKAEVVGLVGDILSDLEVAPSWRDMLTAYPDMRDEVMSVFSSKATSLPFNMRYKAAVALGRAGDTRLTGTQRFVSIPAGIVSIGAQRSDEHSDNFDPSAQSVESPVHRVYTGPFEMSRFPVTVQEYREFVAAKGNGQGSRKTWESGEFADSQGSEVKEPDAWPAQLAFPNCPVVGIDWFEARAYCSWLTDRDKSYEYRLPTEAEWEFVARRGTDKYSPYCYPRLDVANLSDEIHSMEMKGPERSSPVGLFPADQSKDGVSDLNGNVQEWVADPASQDGPLSYESALKPAISCSGAESSIFRMVRGGSFQSTADACRSSYRDCYHARNRYSKVGFRVVRRPKPIAIKGRSPQQPYQLTLADEYVKHDGVYSLEEAQKAIRSIASVGSRLNATFLQQLFPKGLDFSKPRLPCRCREIPGKFQFNLRYQDTRLKLAVEDFLWPMQGRRNYEEHALNLMDAVSILLRTTIPGLGIIADVLTDNDLDAIVYNVLAAYDPKRKTRLLEAGYKTNAVALLAVPSFNDQIRMPIQDIVGYHVFAGTVWWDHASGDLKDQFSHRQPLVLNDIDRFEKEVIKRPCQLVFVFDDNGELVWDLVLIQYLLQRNTHLNVTGIVNSNVVANNSNMNTLNKCLLDEKLAHLRSYSASNPKRFTLVEDKNLRSSIDLDACSEAVRQSLSGAGAVLVKGVAAFETLQRLPSPVYYSFVVYSDDSITCTGLEKGAGVFVRVPPRTMAYSYRQKTLSHLRLGW